MEEGVEAGAEPIQAGATGDRGKRRGKTDGHGPGRGSPLEGGGRLAPGKRGWPGDDDRARVGEKVSVLVKGFAVEEEGQDAEKGKACQDGAKGSPLALPGPSLPDFITPSRHR